MATPTLDEILALPTVDEAMDGQVLPELRLARDSVVLPVSDWSPGDPFRALAWATASLFVEAKRFVSAFAAACFGDYAFGLADHPSGIDVTGFATAKARDTFGVTRIPASYTKRTIRLTNSVAAVYGPIAAGRVIIQFTATGNRYVNDAALTIAASTTTDAVFRSEYAVNSSAGLTYLDSSGSTIQIVTASYPGVTATNPASTYSTVRQVGGGTGVVTPSLVPVGTHNYAVRIDTDGQVGVATWSYRVDGLAWTSAGAVAAVANVGGFGMTLTLTNGATGVPSFLHGTYYFVQHPGTDVTVSGRNEETPQELGVRARAILPLLDWTTDSSGNFVAPATPTVDAYRAMTLTAFPEECKHCYVRTGTYVNDEVDIFVAAQGGTLGSATMSLIQAFWDRHAGLTNWPVVQPPAVQAITLAACTVTVKKAQLYTAQAAIQIAIADYLAGLDQRRELTMGDGVTTYVRRDWIISLITSTVGVTDVTDVTLTINGAAADYLLAADTLATWTQAVSTAFAWATV